MSSNINYGGKYYEEIEVDKLTKFLQDCESVSKQNCHSVPAILFNSNDMSFKGFKTSVTISRGLHGGLFTIIINDNGLSDPEEFYTEADLCYRVFVPRDYIKSLKRIVV